MLLMLRLRRWLRVLLILLTLLAVIGAPVLIEGYVDVGRAQAALNRQEFSRAAQYSETAARLLPWEPDWWERAALSYLSAKDSPRAVAMFETARTHNALSVRGWQTFGSVYWEEGNFQEALEIWSAGLQQYPTSMVFYSSLALAYKGLGNYAAERAALQVWLSTGSGNAREHYELALLLLTSDPGRARQELARASSMDKALNPAVGTLQTAIDLSQTQPDDSHRLMVIGRGLGLVNEWALARQALEQSVAADDQNAEAWAWLGEARQDTGDDGRAESDRALALGPNDIIVHALRGLYWRRHSQFSAALDEYLIAARMEPGNPEWQAALGEAYSLNGDLVSALDSYQKATSLAPENATYWRLLAMFCADSGVQVLEVGLPAARQAAALAPDDPQALDALGWSFAQAGLLQSAEQTLTKATKLAPELALLHLHLGETYLREANPTSAYEELNLVRQLDKEGPEGQLAQQLLNQYFP